MNFKANRPENKKVTLRQLIFSVLAAFFGVQSNKIRERDFNSDQPLHYIIMGIIVAVIFVLIISGVVTLILHYAGK
jgi:hypothetical protein